MSEDFNVPTLQQVFDSMDSLFSVIDLIDENYKMFNNNYLMRHFQNQGITLRTIFLSDMLDWLCFLGWGDGHIDSSEVRFINDLLKLNLSQLDILEIVKNLDAERLTTLPLSFAIFMEHEMVSDTDASIVDAIYTLFFISGSYLIVCDGNVDDNEVKGLQLYMDTLKGNIRRFDLESLHEYMLDRI